MDYQLICEGRCNPLIAHIDEAVTSAAEGSEHRWNRGPKARGTKSLWAAQRELKYTPHFRVSPLEATCRVCGAIRRWVTAA